MVQQVSVIIPNYNGQKLLAKNLPTVIKNCINCEIIVVDDGSTDESVKLIHDKFETIKIIEIKKNKGFSNAINKGVSSAKGNLILLLNTDVVPHQNFLTPSLKHFSNNNIFAVGLNDQSHESEKILSRGRGSASFTKGFLNHYKLPSQKGETLWVSGGSGLFDKRKYQELGGFDISFAPFYWEDIDLSFRAWRAGFKCLFEPKSKVDHYHVEGSITKKSSKFYIKSVSYKNQFIFVWKNIDDYFLMTQHLLWLPYHFIKALINLDIAFYLGFFWTVFKIPSLILNDEHQTINYELSVQEVLGKFEK